MKTKFNKVVIWGLKHKYHTHRYIHASFYRVLKKLGIPVVWTDNQESLIQKDDLVMSTKLTGRFVKDGLNVPVKPDVYYCLMNLPEEKITHIEPGRFVILKPYISDKEAGNQQWDKVVFFNPRFRILYQPWGTDLLPGEFKPPTFNRHRRVFWVGSVWNDEHNQGNLREIAELKEVLKNRGLAFYPVRFVPDGLHRFLIRRSRLAPAIGGGFQAAHNYLPCRMFKNISYGQLAFSNIKKFDDLFVTLKGSISEMVDKALSLSEREYKDFVRQQQEAVKHYTYEQGLKNIFKAFEV